MRQVDRYTGHVMGEGPQNDGVPSTAPHGVIKGVLRAAGALVCLAAGTLLLAWLIGRVLTDRYDFSQWLWWLPTPVVLASTLLAVFGAMRPAVRRVCRRRVIVWSSVLVFLVGWFTCAEHRFLKSPVETVDGVTIAHWNMSHPSPEEFPQYTAAALQIDADVLVLSSPSLVTAQQDLLEELDAGRVVHRYGIFSVVTRVPVLMGRPLVNREGIWSYMIELDTRDALGRTTVLYLIDLPAIDYENPETTFERSRMDLARQFRTLLDAAAAPTPDVVVGDFNITRGSASLLQLFPDMTHAYDSGGHGYGATFHRALPYAHIDHILTAPGVTAVRYDIINPGVGRHHAQRARIVADATK